MNIRSPQALCPDRIGPFSGVLFVKQYVCIHNTNVFRQMEMLGVNLDWGQIMDGLTVRMDAYRETAVYFEEGAEPEGLIEEVRDGREARKLEAVYRELIGKIREQREREGG